MFRSALPLVCLVVPAFFGLSLVGNTPPAAPVVYKGATIHTATAAPIADGVLVIQKGKIVAVGGPDTPIPKGAHIFDARGQTIIPGLVDTHSHIGLFGRPGVTANSDGNEGSGAVQSGLRALDAINPDDPSLRMALAGGVTCANIMPGSGNVIGGQTLYVKLRGRTVEAMILVPDGVLGGMKLANGENPKTFNFGKTRSAPATRMKLAALQRGEFVKAREYKKRWDDYRRTKAGIEPERDPALEPLVEVLQRKRTVHFHCHRADDLMTALRLAREFNFEIVLQHATEGYRVARELAAARVPVSLTLADSPGGKPEVMGLVEENAARLSKAGVLVAISTDDR